MLELDLSGNLMNREGARSVSTCIHNIEKLGVVGCHMSEDAIELLAVGIRKRSKPVKYLFNLLPTNEQLIFSIITLAEIFIGNHQKQKCSVDFSLN